MRHTPPPMHPPPYAGRPMGFPVTRLRVGRILLLLVIAGTMLLGGAYWLLTTQARTIVTPPSESTGWPAWLRQAQTYPTTEPLLPKSTPPPPDPNAGLLAKLSALQADLQRQQLELDLLKKRPSGTTVVQAPQQKAPPAPPPPKPHASMLYVTHELKDAPPKPKATEYTLAPGATKLPCVIETAMNSDVEGEFTAKVSTNVYDTATGHHLLVPQGSTILGHDQSSTLLYGNERLPTISMTLALPDGRSVDLGHAPVTDQQGVTGLTGKVDQHFLRLLGAVFIGGALRGGQQVLQLQAAQAGPLGQVGAGIGQTGGQASQQRIGRALDTRPTIEVAAGSLCTVLLTRPLSLPAMWQ
jgi:type IV secretory pathway VirB10-like protein